MSHYSATSLRNDTHIPSHSQLVLLFALILIAQVNWSLAVVITVVEFKLAKKRRFFLILKSSFVIELASLAKIVKFIIVF